MLLMKVAAILSQKGGSGKSTLATNLARSFQRRGLEVLLVDCDKQTTAADWSLSADSEPVPVVTQQQKGKLEEAIPRLGEGFDLVVIDGAAHAQRLNASAVRASDIVLIPIQPSSADVWSAEETVEIVKARQAVTDGLPRAALVISRAITGTNVAGQVEDFLRAFELPVLRGTHQRIAYVKAMGQGRGVQDLSSASKAAKEIDQLTDDVEDLLKETN